LARPSDRANGMHVTVHKGSEAYPRGCVLGIEPMRSMKAALSSLDISVVSRYLGLSGMYIFGFTAWWSTSLADLGLGLMALAFLLRLPAQRWIWRDALFIVSLLFGVYLMIRTVGAVVEFPFTKSEQIDRALDLYRLGFLLTVVFAFSLSDAPRRVLHVLNLALAGFLVRIILHYEPGDLERFLEGARASFDMSPNAFGLYCSVALLGLILGFSLFLPHQGRRYEFFLRGAVWLAATSVVAMGLVFSQSRGAWLGIALVLPVMLFVQVFFSGKEGGSWRRTLAGVVLLAGLVVVGLLGFAAKDVAKNRAVQELDTLRSILSGEESHIAFDAYGMRYHWWRFGVERWSKRPWFGWGPGTVAHLFRHSEDPLIRQWSQQFKDFHNSLLQTLVQIGLVGLGFYVAFLCLILRAAWRGYRAGWLTLELYLITVGSMVLFIISSLANLRTRDHFGQFHLILFAGIAYAYSYARALHLPEMVSHKDPKSPPSNDSI
jgi:O-antigen ligase